MGKGLLQITCLVIAVYGVCCIDPDPCLGKTDYTRLPGKTTECRQFVECLGGTSKQLSCPPNHRYHHETQSCVLGTDCEGGGYILCTSSKCAEGKYPDPTQKKPVCVGKKKWICENNKVVPDCAEQDQNIFIWDPNSCEGYYRCINKMRYSGSCKTGLRFDRETKSCDYEENVDCNEFGATITIVPTKDICKNAKEPFVTDPNSCQTYLQCESPTLPPYQGFCPYKTNPYFKDGKCVKTAPANCGCETVMDSIKEDGDVIQVKALRPDQYWVCTTRGAELKTCIAGTVYNNAEKGCVKK